MAASSECAGARLSVQTGDGISCRNIYAPQWILALWSGRHERQSALVPRFINTTTFVASIFGSGEARRGSIPRSGAVTEEQRSQNRKATQPSGRRFFSAQTSLLAPYRPLKGMRVARASSEPKIPRRKRGRIYETEYLGRDERQNHRGTESWSATRPS